MLISEILDKAADKLAKPNAWTKGCNARDAHGNPVEVRNRAAVCWCFVGAAFAVTEHSEDCGFDAVLFAGERLRTIAHSWNDAPGRTQAEVVAKARELAALARAEGK